jgi:serine/threonine protein kinase
VIALLTNLVRGVHFLSTQGTPRSSYLRCEKLIDQLLQGLQPKRQQGEMVAPGKDWRLERYLGMGSFGEVWMARNTNSPKLPPRAFKFFTDKGAQEWIQEEQHNLSEVFAKLGKHPHIIEFYDVTIGGQKWPFLELEYVGGGSLEDWIVEDETRRVKLQPYEIIRGVVLGLAAAHGQGICHRDLKPANILLTEPPKAQAKIADFGLAKVTGDIRGAGSIGASQAFQVGTSMYLPPEAQQLLLERDPAQDDVFALGVMWYQLLVGRLERPPYDFADLLREAGQDSHTIQLISRCLAQPERRFRDAVELDEEMVELPPPQPVPPGRYDVQHLIREYLTTATK